MKKRDTLIGRGVGLAAVAAAGSYFLYGKRGPRIFRPIAGWSLKMKGEVLEQIEGRKEIDEQAYRRLVDDTARRYGRSRRVQASQLQRLTKELQGAWTHISKRLI
ncbi:MAG: hypothetical protein NTY77_10915 [Elusimicrobia bacterium]|nr:hypothetical protein [Elusimicrobiota bacterium]